MGIDQKYNQGGTKDTRPEKPHRVSDSAALAGYVPNSTKEKCVRLICECLQGHGLGHNNTPEKWNEHAEKLYDMVHKAVTGT